MANYLVRELVMCRRSGLFFGRGAECDAAVMSSCLGNASIAVQALHVYEPAPDALDWAARYCCVTSPIQPTSNTFWIHRCAFQSCFRSISPISDVSAALYSHEKYVKSTAPANHGHISLRAITCDLYLFVLKLVQVPLLPCSEKLKHRLFPL